MSSWPSHLEGWDLSPPQHNWGGFALHTATRVGAPGATSTCWIAESEVSLAMRAAWSERISVARTWSHPGLPELYDGGVWEGRPWAVTARVRRGDLWSFRSHVAPQPFELERYARALFSALVYAAERNVAHGIVSVEAIVIADGRLRLAGFGLVDVLRTPKPELARDLAAAIDTLRFMAGPGAEASRLTQVVAALAAGPLTPQRALDLLGPEEEAPEAAPPPLRVGRYELIEQVAQGGMGVVWRARDPDLDRIVAVKVHHPTSVLPEKALNRFRQEARAAGRLDHPAIVRILDFGSGPEGLFFAMEYIEGTDLGRRLGEVGRIDPHLAARWTATLARGLAHAHLEGIVHRDIKPANILLERGDAPRIADFGLAVSLDDETDDRITRDGQVMGTPVYMPPEQASGRVSAIGPRSDIYSLGAVLYEMLTGRPPFRNGPAAAVVYDIVYNSPEPILRLAPDIPVDLTWICMKAMEPDPKDRYPTMEAFALDLEHFLVGEPILARAPRPWSKMRAWARRNRTAAVAVGASALLVALVGGGLALTVRKRATERAAREATAERLLLDATQLIRRHLANADTKAAERAFADLVARPELLGTPSWFRAWTEEATRRANADDATGERDALGQAWLNAPTQEERTLALTAIAGSWRRELRYDHVDATLATLESEGVQVSPGSPLATLQAESALYRWDVAGVDHPAQPMVAALATRREIPLNLASLSVDPLDNEIGLRTASGLQTWLVAADGVPRPLPAPPEGAPIYRLYGSAAKDTLRACAYDGVSVRVLRFATRWVEEARVPVEALTHCFAVDRGDARPAFVLAALRSREVTLLNPEGESGWRHGAPLWPPDALRADLEDVETADFDGDGAVEMALAVGAWTAYDVRVYGASADAERMLGRLRIGGVRSVHAIDVDTGGMDLVVGSTETFPNPTIWGATTPFTGITILDFTRDRLEVTWQHAVPGGCVVIGVGDADADGRADVVADCLGTTLFVRQTRDGFATAAVSDFSPLGVVDMDRDGDVELIGRDDATDRLVIAGLKGTARSPAPRFVAQPAAALSGPDGEVRLHWAREHTLTELGLTGGVLARLSATSGSNDSDALRLQSRLESSMGLHEEAARSGVAALRDLVDQKEAAEHAVTEMLTAIDPESARTLAAAGTTTANPLFAPLASARSVSLSMAEPLDPRWIIRDPAALRRDRARGVLRVEPIAHRDLAVLPLDVRGGVLRLEVDLEVDYGEWDGGLEFAILPEGGGEPVLSAMVRSLGGGGAIANFAQVSAGPAFGWEGPVEAPRRTAASNGRLRLVAAMHAGTDAARTRVDVDGAMHAERTGTLVDPANLPDGRYDLVLRRSAKTEAVARFTARLHRITIDGATIASGPVLGTPGQRAMSSLVEGAADDALATLRDTDGPEALETRMWAYLELGRGKEAAEQYAALLRAVGPTDVTMAPVRTRPRWAVEVLRRTLGPTWTKRAWMVWSWQVIQLPDDEDIGREFTNWAEALPDGGIDTRADGAMDHVEALFHLARADRAQGRLSAASDVLDRIVLIDASTRDPDHVRRQLLRADAHIELARIAAIRGEVSDVQAHLRAALEGHPTPEAIAEQLTADPIFLGLRVRDWWTPLVAPFRRFGARAAVH